MSLARKIGALFGAGGSTLTTSSAGGGQAHPNLPPTLVVLGITDRGHIAPSSAHMTMTA